MFSCEFCKIFKNSFFPEHLGASASGIADSSDQHLRCNSSLEKSAKGVKNVEWNDIWKYDFPDNRLLFRTVPYVGPHFQKWPEYFQKL